MLANIVRGTNRTGASVSLTTSGILDIVKDKRLLAGQGAGEIGEAIANNTGWHWSADPARQAAFAKKQELAKTGSALQRAVIGGGEFLEGARRRVVGRGDLPNIVSAFPIAAKPAAVVAAPAAAASAAPLINSVAAGPVTSSSTKAVGANGYGSKLQRHQMSGRLLNSKRAANTGGALKLAGIPNPTNGVAPGGWLPTRAGIVHGGAFKAPGSAATSPIAKSVASAASPSSRAIIKGGNAMSEAGKLGFMAAAALAGGAASYATGGGFFQGAAAGALTGMAASHGSKSMGQNFVASNGGFKLADQLAPHVAEHLGDSAAKSFTSGAMQVGAFSASKGSRRYAFGAGALLGGTLFGGRSHARGFNKDRGNRFGR
jgi:hypothetical protein